MDRVISLGVRILEALFFIGLLGSAIVVIWSFIEDMATIFTKDEPVVPMTVAENRAPAITPDVITKTA